MIEPNDTDYQQCTHCKEWYFAPVSYHHTGEECAHNQASQAKESE